MDYPTPSVGHQVWFYPSISAHHEDEPQAATVVKVLDKPWSANPFSMVNLQAIDPDTGEATFWTDVPHSPAPVDRPHFRWMPYQLWQHQRQPADGESFGSVLNHGEQSS